MGCRALLLRRGLRDTRAVHTHGLLGPQAQEWRDERRRHPHAQRRGTHRAGPHVNDEHGGDGRIVGGGVARRAYGRQTLRVGAVLGEPGHLRRARVPGRLACGGCDDDEAGHAHGDKLYRGRGVVGHVARRRDKARLGESPTPDRVPGAHGIHPRDEQSAARRPRQRGHGRLPCAITSTRSGASTSPKTSPPGTRRFAPPFESARRRSTTSATRPWRRPASARRPSPCFPTSRRWDFCSSHWPYTT